MRFRLFQYPLPADPELQDLNAFLAGRRVATVSHHVVTQPTGSLLLFVVETVATPPDKSSSGGTPKIDYRDVLTEEEFTVFSNLRTERRRVAELEAVPVYTVFTNAQLAEMVRRRVSSAAAMGEIEGIGRARVEKYGARFLGILTEAFAGTAPDTTGTGS